MIENNLTVNLILSVGHHRGFNVEDEGQVTPHEIMTWKPFELAFSASVDNSLRTVI